MFISKSRRNILKSIYILLALNLRKISGPERQLWKVMEKVLSLKKHTELTYYI